MSPQTRACQMSLTVTMFPHRFIQDKSVKTKKMPEFGLKTTRYAFFRTRFGFRFWKRNNENDELEKISNIHQSNETNVVVPNIP